MGQLLTLGGMALQYSHTLQHRKTPFEVVYGKKPPSLPQYIQGTSTLEAIDTEYTNREEMLGILKRKLLKAQEAMKLQADKRRLGHTFTVGEKVFIKLRPYR
jgi:hypothetical protein